MDQRDRLIAVLGVIVIISSAGVGAAFASGPPDDGDDDVGDLIIVWSTGSRSSIENGLNTQVFGVDVPEHNITSVTVRLSWTDDEIVSPLGQRDDTLTITVKGPSTLEEPPQTASGTSGELVLTYDLATIPVTTDPRDLEDHDYVNATGEWEITVSVAAAGLRDTGNDWAVTFSYEFYSGDLREAPEAG
jgi:hypothetical protein